MMFCPSLEDDLKRVDWIKFKCINSEKYSQNLYAALCNNTFSKVGAEWSCSWRSSGRIISEIRGSGNYIDWYCSGIARKEEGIVEEGFITSEVSSDLLNLGWYLTT